MNAAHAGGERPVLTDVRDRIGGITLNRPDDLNAITTELAIELERGLRALAEEADVIVIRGAAGNFSAGGDFDELQVLRAEGRTATAALFEAFAGACSAIAELPVPVIAAVEGYALAGGFELMQSCDFALVRSDARIGDNHSNFGQVPGGGSSQRLARLVGRQRALALILTGERLTGDQAVAWGLAYKAFSEREFEAGVDAILARLAGHDSVALARSKALVYSGLEEPLRDGLARELTTVLDHLDHEASAASIETFTNRRGRE